jgi:hypothetical protein
MDPEYTPQLAFVARRKITKGCLPCHRSILIAPVVTPPSKSTLGIVVKAESEQQDGRLCSLDQSMRLLQAGCIRDCH